MFFELATTSKNLGAKWLSEKKINFMLWLRGQRASEANRPNQKCVLFCDRGIRKERRKKKERRKQRMKKKIYRYW